MGSNKLFKSIFLVSLGIVLICLSVIAAGSLPNEEPSLSNEIDYSKLKFELLNKNETCEESLSLLYSTKTTEYYTYCKENIYIKWQNGEIDTVEEALIDGKITIENLYNYNIEIVAEDINEN